MTTAREIVLRELAKGRHTYEIAREYGVGEYVIAGINASETFLIEPLTERKILAKALGVEYKGGRSSFDTPRRRKGGSGVGRIKVTAVFAFNLNDIEERVNKRLECLKDSVIDIKFSMTSSFGSPSYSALILYKDDNES